MDEYNFGPARPAEKTVHGAATPDSSARGIGRWITFMRARGVNRVCCLLDVGQLRTFLVPLKAEYEKAFGADRVLMVPIPDHFLCPASTLREQILPFLRSAEAAGERAVVHCWGGNGRTGHVLSAWLVAARGLKPMEAIEAVEAAGRLPREAVLAGNADLQELIDLLAKCEQ